MSDPEERKFVEGLADEALRHPERMGDMAELLEGVDELLRTDKTERHGESLYDIASGLFDDTREAMADPELRQRVRAAINGVLADYQRRRDPARVLSQADFIEAPRGVLSPAEFEKARARLLAEPPPAADMFSARLSGWTRPMPE